MESPMNLVVDRELNDEVILSLNLSKVTYPRSPLNDGRPPSMLKKATNNKTSHKRYNQSPPGPPISSFMTVSQIKCHTLDCLPQMFLQW